MIRTMVLSALMALAAAHGQALAREWIANPAASTLGFATSQAGTAVQGRFERFRVERLFFDASNLEATRLRVTVDLASTRTGDTRRDSNIAGADWFNVAQAPTAVFESQRVQRLASDQYAFEGTLNLRGATVPVVLMAEIASDPTQFRATGTAEVDRLAFGIGMGTDPGARWVPRAVVLRFSVMARPR